MIGKYVKNQGNEYTKLHEDCQRWLFKYPAPSGGVFYSGFDGPRALRSPVVVGPRVAGQRGRQLGPGLESGLSRHLTDASVDASVDASADAWVEALDPAVGLRVARRDQPALCAQAHAAFVKFMPAAGLFALARESIPELAAVVGHQLGDFHRRGLVHLPQEVATADLALMVVDSRFCHLRSVATLMLWRAASSPCEPVAALISARIRGVVRAWGWTGLMRLARLPWLPWRRLRCPSPPLRGSGTTASFEGVHDHLGLDSHEVCGSKG